MYVTYSSKWDASRAVGQERLLVDSWLELVASDSVPPYWGDLYSVLQLVAILRNVVFDVERSVLKEYHIKDLAEEILERMEDETWLENQYPADTFFLKEHLRSARDHSTESSVRQRVASVLSAFLQKVASDEPVRRQMDYLCRLASDASTRYQVITRAVAELTNDLLHAGYSRDRLHGWMLRNVLGVATGTAYLELLQSALQLTTADTTPYRVLFHVNCPSTLPAPDHFRFLPSLPNVFQIDPSSPLVTVTRGCFAEIRVTSCRDPWAAVEQSRRMLRRHFNSNRLAWREFDRSVSNYVAVRDDATGYTLSIDKARSLAEHRLHNDRQFYAIAGQACHENTYSRLDKIIYWLEQSWQGEDLAGLIGQWTALECLCSLAGKSAPEAVRTLVPAYVVPRYPRLLLIDFWKYLLQARISFPAELQARLKIVSRDPHGREPKCDLLELFGACVEPDTTNPIAPLISEYPILQYKWRRLKRLDPQLKDGGADHAAVWHDLSRFERRVGFDLQTCYRVRNAIVHDAAIDVAQLDRVAQRMNWLLCLTLDVILFQFARNPSLTLSELHQVNQSWFQTWKSNLYDHTKAKNLADIGFPRVPCLK